jgi:hypothetical protein
LRRLHIRHPRVPSRISLPGAFLLATISCLLAAGCGPACATYEKYGISFQYPAGFAVIESGLDGGEPDESEGMVQVRSEGGETRAFQVNWLQTMIYGLELSLDNAFAGMERADQVASVERGELREGSKDDRLMLYQPYTVSTTAGARAGGVAAALYYDENGTLFTLVTMNSAVTAEEKILEDFEEYLNSFGYVAE